MQAERKSSTSTHIPDLDNANVGTYILMITGDTLVSLFFWYTASNTISVLWWYLRNRISYNNMKWYQGQKVRKLMQACLQEDFWPLDPPKTWVSSHFSKKNERITNVFEDCESAKHVAIWYQRGQNTFWPQHHEIPHSTRVYTKMNKVKLRLGESSWRGTPPRV